MSDKPQKEETTQDVPKKAELTELIDEHLDAVSGGIAPIHAATPEDDPTGGRLM